MKHPIWFHRIAAVAATLTVAATVLVSQTSTFVLPNVPNDDPILRAMRDELERSQQLKISGGGDPPYYLSYSVTDADSTDISAAMGATYSIVRNKFRAPAIDVLYIDIDMHQETWHVVQPIKFDAHGYRHDS